MSELLGIDVVVVAWAVLLRSVFVECTVALPRVLSRFHAVVSVPGAAGMFGLIACVLRCFGKGAVF